MSGTITGLDLSVLYSGVAASSGVAYGNPILALAQAEQNQPKKIAAEAKTPEVQRDLAAFRKAVAGAKDVKSLLANPTVQRVLLTVNGLADQIGFTALATKALLSKPSDPKSLANVLPNVAWKAAAKTYGFADKGLTILRDPKVLDTVASAYAEISWRKSLDATTPGLSDALTFRDQAASVTKADDILGNPILRRVVTTTLGIPLEIAYQTLNAQEMAITSKLDIKQLKSKNFVKRYLVAAASSAAQATSSAQQQASQTFGLLL
jgi:hypothetical protein